MFRVVTGLITVIPAILAAEDPGWYKVELEDRTAFVGRLIKVETHSYFVSFQGAVLQLSKEKVRRLERLPAGVGETPVPGQGNETGQLSPKRPAPVTQGGGEAGKEHRQDAEGAPAILEAIESLDSTIRENVAAACRTLTQEFELARPFLHQALSHQSPRVRTLALKLLGEQGNADEDLEAVSGRLSDPRPEVRRAAIMAVRALGPRGLQALLDCLKREKVPNNRKLAVKNLQVWRDRRAVVPLVDLLAVEKNPGVRGFIEVALETLTGRKLGSDHEAWAAYLSEGRSRRELEKMVPLPEAGSDR